jgi:4-hydroxybenzoate polyprenyltransferase
MWLCYQHNIYILYLPPHSFHVLQPLDLSIFSPLKTAYRKERGFLLQLNDSTVVGKRNFLECYRKARLAALTVQNMKSRWKATGLWPISMAKPLLSPLLLQNSNKPTLTAANPLTSTLPRSLATPEGILDKPAVVWSTLKKTLELQQQFGQFNRLSTSTTTQRLLFQKVRKAFDEKDAQLATAQKKIESLEAQVEAARPRKRKKVETSPNSKFANIEAIHRAQLEVGEVVDSTDESSESELSSEEGSCIVVEE